MEWKTVEYEVWSTTILETSLSLLISWQTAFMDFDFKNNKAGYTATPVACGGQGLFLRSLDHLGKSSEAKDRKKKKIKCDRRMDGSTNRRTDKAGYRVA